MLVCGRGAGIGREALRRCRVGGLDSMSPTANMVLLMLTKSYCVNTLVLGQLAASSTGKLPAPQLWSEPATRSPAPGTLVRLQCLGPRAGLRFALVHEVAGRSWVRDFQSPADNEAHFELPAVSVVDSGNYSCVYMELAPPFAGSVASEQWELHVDGECAMGSGCFCLRVRGGPLLSLGATGLWSWLLPSCPHCGVLRGVGRSVAEAPGDTSDLGFFWANFRSFLLTVIL